MNNSRMESAAPLLRPWQGDSRPATLATLLSRTSSRRGASLLVRETAARQLEERRTDLTYSKPVVALDILWNLVFVVASVVTLITSVKEKPNMPLRAWICVYAALCLFHVALVWWEFRCRNMRRMRDLEAYLDYSGESEEEDGLGINYRESVAKKCEYASSMVSLLWWMVGFYWVVSESEFLKQSAPHLYCNSISDRFFRRYIWTESSVWLVVVFLAFDVFFTIFVLVLACLIATALCCCLPCIIALLYAIAGQEGASDADINTLPKYNFQVCKDGGKPTDGAGKMVPIETNSGHVASERTVFCEDAECCICLSQYEDGTELNSLPCNHHFHSTCVVKWLKMNATCPLCKYNILKGNEES